MKYLGIVLIILFLAPAALDWAKIKPEEFKLQKPRETGER